MARLLHSGQLTEPVHVASKEPGWFHVTCDRESKGPCMVACTSDGLPCGDSLAPGSSLDVRDTDGIWIGPPRDGRKPTVQVELRQSPTYRSISPLEEVALITTWKATPDVPIVPGQWNPILSRVIGLVGIRIRVRGGTARISTHVSASLPPQEAVPGVKGHVGGFPIYPSDPPLWLPGNAAFYAWTDDKGVVLQILKIAGGAHFDLPAEAG